MQLAGLRWYLLYHSLGMYVTGKCCKDDMHITNYGTKGFWSELDRPELSVKTAIAALDYEK